MTSLAREAPTAIDARAPRARSRAEQQNGQVAATRRAADAMAALFNLLARRGVAPQAAQRFVLQQALRLFAEATLPRPDAPFAPEGALELVEPERALLARASSESWSKVSPAIFGALFQDSMDKAERHAFGAHYTSEADIERVLLPTLVRPLRERLAAATTREALLALRGELCRLQILDPACGSGDFLYVAYRDLVHIEMDLLARLRERAAGDAPIERCGDPERDRSPCVSLRQFYGIDINPLAVELTRATLLLGEALARREALEAALGPESPLPAPADLTTNIVCGDALFTEWPRADVIIGNPPYQSKNKMQAELGAAYVQRLRERYPGVPGRADYCVYWFRRAHDHLALGGRAGLVGTNTIRQNDSRTGGLGYIVEHGGTIVDAVSTQVWSGPAQVHVSIVSWVKEDHPGPKALHWQEGDVRGGPWRTAVVDHISASLQAGADVTAARSLRANSASNACFQGQTHGHEAFLIAPAAARAMMRAEPRSAEVLFPFLIADALLGSPTGAPERYVIDFGQRNERAARRYKAPFARVEALALPARQAAADRERRRNEAASGAPAGARLNHHHATFLARFWQLSWPRPELVSRLIGLQRYIACARVAKRPIFEFISAVIRPNDALVVFPLEDDYSFGVLQSSVHWCWLRARCSTLKGDLRYTSETAFDSFPWPQAPTEAEARRVADAARSLRAERAAIMRERRLSRRSVYRRLDDPSMAALKEAHSALDLAVRAAYGMPLTAAPLEFLLDANLALADLESRGAPIQGPGLPASVDARVSRDFITSDCVQAPGLEAPTEADHGVRL